MAINEEAIQLSSTTGFIQIFYKILADPKYKTNQEAYEAVEEKHKKYFRKRRYKNYDSFRKVRDRRNKPIK